MGGPRVKDDPPYDEFLAANVEALGFKDSTAFASSDIAGDPNGIYLAFVLIPDPGTVGSSFDFESGPIIPSELFPIDIDTDLLREGQIVDSDLDGQTFGPGNFDGESHAPWFVATNAMLFSSETVPIGQYEYQVTLLDQVGFGWNLTAAFGVSSCSPVNELLGDLDGSGTVDFSDFLAMSANFGRNVASYSRGDVNCDGSVGFDDFLVLSSAFGNSAAPQPVPEPSSFLLVIIGSVAVSRVGRRSSRLAWRRGEAGMRLL